MGVLWAYRLSAFTHVGFGLLFLGGVLVGSYFVFFDMESVTLDSPSSLSQS